jgi:carboxyl-terminal processing protease
LTIAREGVEPFDLNIIRDIIVVKSVKFREEGDVGYIRVTSFSETTTDGVRNAVQELQQKQGDNLKGFVLDLRNNPGGLLDQSIGVASVFLKDGEVVSTKGRHPEDAESYKVDTTSFKAKDLPIVVLINGGSASASEIVAGALQDQKRAIVLGTQSFGKGSVQTVLPMPGHGAIRLTTARYYTPAGRSIQAKGITPDITVEAGKLESTEAAMRLRESDLRGALPNPDAPANDNKPKAAEPVKKPEVTPATPAKPEAAKPTDAKDKKDEDAYDNQLQRGLDLIRGLSLYDNKTDKKTTSKKN